MPDFIHHGEPVNFSRLLGHYRLMMRIDRKSVAFWRDMARTIIRERREQLSAWRIAA
jgi:hypothetical protein